MQKQLEKLYKNKVKNIMMIDAIERGVGQILLDTEDSMIIQSVDFFLIHSTAKHEWPLIEDTLHKHYKLEVFAIFIAHDEWLIEPLVDTFGFTRVTPYLNGYVPSDLVLEEVNVEKLIIKPLTQDDHAFVRRVYQLIDSDEYIHERIDHGMIGAWYDGDLVGFAGEHDEGSMGMLEVIPEARGRGIAKALSNAMITKMRKENRQAYTNASPENIASVQLQKKMGFEVADEPLYWLFK